jgi:phosphonate transport system substrate-binding protein
MTAPFHRRFARPFREVRQPRRSRRHSVIAMALVLLGLPWALHAGEPAPLRFGFSSETFFNVNESDARAALKIWAQTLSSEQGIPVDPVLDIYSGVDAIKAALLSGAVDAVTMTTLEYWAMRDSVPLGPFIMGRSHGTTTERYVLLVHRDNPATQVADLKGKSLNIAQGARGCLAPIWMETLLFENNLGPAADFWGKTAPGGKLARVVLPVFFRQVDACIVTEAGFRTMSELNPQVGRQLKILAESRELIPVVFCFRQGLDPRYRDKLLANIEAIADAVAGRQTLSLFQAERMEQRPISDLDDACALLDRHQHLVEAFEAQATARPAAPPPTPPGGNAP